MPCFFQENLSQDSFTLSSEESKHITKSLRLKAGDYIWITDGKGTLAKAVLTNIFRDACTVAITERVFDDKSKQKQLHLAVAPTKNPDRMEWLVEKAVEIGVSQISFIICDHSERKNVDMNRLQRIAIAALKQSKGTWIPKLKALSFSQFLQENSETVADKFIAYCDDKAQSIEISNIRYQQKDAIFLIGPEGDFTSQEVQAAKEHHFQQISLGEKTLRTETAALFVTCCFALSILT
ncbi:MAG: 16S rRNA (uracil(1498)-N(3))-methyltransferase [Bacteroidetes bacterium]|nr:16S rRNA (uracil(1498)-N(3))-methyltransferase [Bacteroidota bacterium]MCL1968175.1 16S rRNA (uracil(1498)-N(3))-methyltransferase [Bacteroidota bacterium]MCL1968542.1 16S rRNA (uracil(1498)-N(3))-methyltransferase [Bacteroidota bacterium]